MKQYDAAERCLLLSTLAAILTLGLAIYGGIKAGIDEALDRLEDEKEDV